MNQRCGHPLPGGNTCRHRVVDPSRPDCGRHSQHGAAGSAEVAPPAERDCVMRERKPGVWRCLIHNPDSPEWQAARALGAQLPCRIPELADYKRAMAKAEALDFGTAALLASDFDMDVRRAVAENRSAPGPVLERLAGDPEQQVRWWVAANPSTPVPVLEQLASDPKWWVREAVARNPGTPSPVLERLATDPTGHIRCAVARNPNTPGPVLERLAEDPDEDVQKEAAKHSGAPTAAQ